MRALLQGRDQAVGRHDPVDEGACPVPRTRLRPRRRPAPALVAVLIVPAADASRVLVFAGQGAGLNQVALPHGRPQA